MLFIVKLKLAYFGLSFLECDSCSDRMSCISNRSFVERQLGGAEGSATEDEVDGTGFEEAVVAGPVADGREVAGSEADGGGAGGVEPTELRSTEQERSERPPQSVLVAPYYVEGSPLKLVLQAPSTSEPEPIFHGNCGVIVKATDGIDCRVA